MTQNKNTSEQLLLYTVQNRQAVAGNQQMVASLKGVYNAAANARAITSEYDAVLGKLGAGASANLALFEQKLRDIDRQEQQSLQTNKALTEEFRRQTNYLSNRLKFAEQTDLASLRNSIGASPVAPNDVGGGVGIGGRISRLGRNIYNLPDVPLGNSGISSTVVSRGLLLGGAGAEAIGLTAAQLGALGVVGGVAALAIKTVTDAEAARGEAAKKTADQLLQISEQVGRGVTTEDLTARNQDLARQRDYLQSGQDALLSYQERIRTLNDNYGRGVVSADEYRTVLTNINAELYDATGGTLGLKDGVGQYVAQAGDFNNVLNQNSENIKAVNSELAVNNIALQSQAVAANDVAAAYEEATKRQQENAEALRRRQTEIQLGNASTSVEAQRLTADQRAAAIESIQLEITTLEQYRATHELTAEAAGSLAIRLDDLRYRSAELQNVTLSYADVQAQLTKQQEDALSAIAEGVDRYQEFASQLRSATIEQTADRLAAIRDEQEALQRAIPALQQLAPTSKDAADELASVSARLNELSDEFGLTLLRVVPAAIARAGAQLDTDLARLSNESGKKLAAIEAERAGREQDAEVKRDKDLAKLRVQSAKNLSDALKKIQDDSDKRILRLRQQATTDLQKAIARGDQAAAIERLEEQRAAIQEERENRTTAEEEKKEQLAAQLEEQTQLVKDRYQEQVDAARDAANKAIAAERARLKTETDERRAAYNEQLALLTQFSVNGKFQIAEFVSKTNAELAKLKVPVVSSNTYVPSGNAGTAVKGSVSGSGSLGITPLPITPNIGDTWKDATGKLWLWNGRAWQPATAVRAYANGGLARGVSMINDGRGAESGLNYRTNQLMHFTDPIQIFSAERTRQMMNGGTSYGDVHVTINGTTLNEQQLTRAIQQAIEPRIEKRVSDNMSRIYRKGK